MIEYLNNKLLLDIPENTLRAILFETYEEQPRCHHIAVLTAQPRPRSQLFCLTVRGPSYLLSVALNKNEKQGLFTCMQMTLPKMKKSHHDLKNKQIVRGRKVRGLCGLKNQSCLVDGNLMRLRFWENYILRYVMTLRRRPKMITVLNARRVEIAI